jgi:hypothetical protein
VVIPVAADIGKGGISGIYAGVNHSDHHTLPFGGGRNCAAPQIIRADPLRPVIGVEPAHLVWNNRGDPGKFGYPSGFGLAHFDRHTVKCGLEGVRDIDAAAKGLFHALQRVRLPVPKITQIITTVRA